MLPNVTLNNVGSNMAKLPVQPVHFRSIPSSKTQAELEELEKNINSVGKTAANSAISKPNEAVSSETGNKPERLRFDTYEPSKPMESAGIYEPTVDENGNKTVAFVPPKEDKAMLYEIPEHEKAAAAPSNLTVDTDKSSVLDERSLLKIASNTRGSELNEVALPKPPDEESKIVSSLPKDDKAMLYAIPEREKTVAAPSNLTVNTDNGSVLDERSLLKIASNTRGSELNEVTIPKPTGTGIGFGANEETSSIEFSKEKEASRIDMLTNELAQAAQKMNLTPASETLFS